MCIRVDLCVHMYVWRHIHVRSCVSVRIWMRLVVCRNGSAGSSYLVLQAQLQRPIQFQQLANLLFSHILHKDGTVVSISLYIVDIAFNIVFCMDCPFTEVRLTDI